MENGINGISLEYSLPSKDEPRQAGIEFATDYENLVVTTSLEGVALDTGKANARLV